MRTNDVILVEISIFHFDTPSVMITIIKSVIKIQNSIIFYNFSILDLDFFFEVFTSLKVQTMELKKNESLEINLFVIISFIILIKFNNIL